MLRPLIHYGIHFALPLAIAFAFFPKNRWGVALLLLAGIAIDLDHLWAYPTFDPDRCSIGFHPLHSYVAIAGYAALLLFPKTRLVGLALMIHMAADLSDCWLLALEG